MSVYFARSGDYMKIGYSRDPLARAESITRLGTRPVDLPERADVRLIGWIPGDRRRERELHEAFGEQRVAGEWFHIDAAEVEALIWGDPGGIDIERMSGMAVIAAIKYPNATRDDIAAAGIPIEAGYLQVALDQMLRGA